MCFSAKQKIPPLQVNKSSHPLFKLLLNKLNCNYQQTNRESFNSFKNGVKNFVKDFGWKDTFDAPKFAVQSNYTTDDREIHLAHVISQLNINSIRLSNKVMPGAAKGLAAANPSRDTQHLTLLHLKQMFDRFKRSQQLDQESLVRLMVRVDYVWRMILQNKYDSPQLLALVLSILDFFDLNDLSAQIQAHAQNKFKSSDSKNSSKAVCVDQKSKNVDNLIGAR
jgi:hypothetical protein